jgi:hypothetical protein
MIQLNKVNVEYDYCDHKVLTTVIYEIIHERNVDI